MVPRNKADGSQLMARCKTIDQPMLEKTKLDKVLPRLVKRGDDQGRIFAQKILHHAADSSTHKDSIDKSNQKQQTNGNITRKASADAKDGTNERLGESRIILDSNAKSSTQSPAQKPPNATDHRHTTTKADSKPNAKPTGPEAPGTKIKTTQITPKPTSFFAGLKSASKKPGTSAKLEEGKAR